MIGYFSAPVLGRLRRARPMGHSRGAFKPKPSCAEHAGLRSHFASPALSTQWDIWTLLQAEKSVIWMPTSRGPRLYIVPDGSFCFR